MKHLNIALQDYVLEALDAYAKESCVQKKKVVELALVDYLHGKGVVVKQPVKAAIVDQGLLMFTTAYIKESNT